MKFTTTTTLAVLAAAACVSAAPSPVEQTTQLVKKLDVSDALALIEELGQLNQKRELIDDANELHELSKRADSLLAQLIQALSNSGLISVIWNDLTKDLALKTQLTDLIKLAIKGAITAAPSLITAIWQSGLLQDVFKTIFNDAQLRLVLFQVAKALFSSGLNLLKAFLSSRGGAASGTTPAGATPSAAAKREVVEFDAELYYDKRDLISVATTVVNAIKSTGLVQALVKKVLADPQASINFLVSAFKNGLVVAKDIYTWAKNNGLLAKGLAFIQLNGPTFASEVSSFLGKEIVAGNASVEDIDNASLPEGTTTATTAAATTLVQKRMY